ncbi:MAG: ribokinase [Kiritimatiellae bacterium]|jgi:ribokinase|nr:ribokinase [Kiritimatiellia bacterium]MDD2348325.1 ribokinase [Kiritimatiellia bacterium]MDD3584660.1 ribokinase [Kiritimatiellia bacterium]HHU13774.1 ribokinase [Lentisphaerota bacterium]
MKRIVVVGSTNTDMVVKAARIPAPGETILGGRFLMNPGGKGANQAVAAARLGAEVVFIAKVGDDLFGREAKALFAKENICTDYVLTDPSEPSGVALIMVDAKGENCIAVASGANGTLMPEDIEGLEGVIAQSDLLLMQLETPLETVRYAADVAVNLGVPVILNPAPACELPSDLYDCLEVITPNESEAELLTNIKVTDEASAEAAARVLCDKGVLNVVITMGAKGAYVFDGEDGVMVPAFKVEAVDTTAAGDVFNGALAVALTEELELEEAVRFASKAASISVTRMGAQASAPRREELVG